MSLRVLFATVIFLTASAVLFQSCKKKNDQEPLVIIPTVTPLPYSVVAYLLTPPDKTFNPDYYRAAKSTVLELQGWYKYQMANGKTFRLNPVVIDTITGIHNSNWFNSNNGEVLYNGTTAYSFYNTKYELKQLLGSAFDTVHNTYLVFVSADFADHTQPRGIAAQGLANLEGLMSSSSDPWKGRTAHSLAHAFGLHEATVPDPDDLMAGSFGQMSGFLKYPACLIKSWDQDSLNAGPFFVEQ